jgi:hypothetical protein
LGRGLIGPFLKQFERIKLRLKLSHGGSSRDQNAEQDRATLRPSELSFQFVKPF